MIQTTAVFWHESNGRGRMERLNYTNNTFNVLTCSLPANNLLKIHKAQAMTHAGTSSGLATWMDDPLTYSPYPQTSTRINQNKPTFCVQVMKKLFPLPLARKRKRKLSIHEMSWDVLETPALKTSWIGKSQWELRCLRCDSLHCFPLRLCCYPHQNNSWTRRQKTYHKGSLTFLMFA